MLGFPISMKAGTEACPRETQRE
jgi:hypothetical protein